MNYNPADNAPKIKKESKNKIKIEMERTPLLERLRGKYLNGAFYGKLFWFLFRFLFLIGVSYVILFPFFAKITSSFMSAEDFVDVTVQLLPKYPTLETYKAIIVDNGYFEAVFNTLILAGSCAIIQTFICSLVAYGFAKFKFKGNGILFLIVIFTMIVPHATIEFSMYLKFRYFDVLWIGELLGPNVLGLMEEPYFNLLNTYWPMWIMSLTALGFKNGLYIFMLRQFFKGVPDELEESAYIDGSGTFRTYMQIILPLSGAMLVTVFMFAFSWQWMDNFYIDMFFTSNGPSLMDSIIKIPKSLDTNYAGQSLYESAIKNTAGLMIIIPLLVMYIFGQKYIVQGIERSGITG